MGCTPLVKVYVGVCIKAAENVSECVFNFKYSDEVTEKVTDCDFNLKYSSEATENVLDMFLI